jgi:phytanoyl-CoA hydroxylase
MILPMTSTPTFDSTGQAPMHPPDLYRHDAVCAPADGWTGLDEETVALYRRDGYLAVAGAFTSAEVEGAVHGLADLINGKVPSFSDITFEAAVRARLHELTSEQRHDAVRKLMHFCPQEPRLHALAYHPSLIAVLRTLLGGREPRMFQDMALLKPPKIGREKPWHQDHAYFNLPLGTPVVGVWVALDEATLDNGCMRVLHQGHQQGPQPHFKRRDWQLCDTQIPRHGVVACPLKPGGLLLFDGLLPHGTPHNTSPARRRAVQFHYAPADAVECAEAERLRHFGPEGKGVEC